MKHELAFCVCNSILHCKFEDAYRLMSSCQYLTIIVDVLKLQNKDKDGLLTRIALNGIANVFKLSDRHNRARKAIGMPDDHRVETIFTEFETLGGRREGGTGAQKPFTAEF